jgi:hypothetical protein
MNTLISLGDAVALSVLAMEFIALLVQIVIEREYDA